MRCLILAASCAVVLCVPVLSRPACAVESQEVQLAEDLSGPGTLAIAAGAVIVPLLADGKQGAGDALRAVDAMACATLVTEVLKHAVHEPRPSGRGHDSFPSEHATLAFAAATMAADRDPDSAPYWYGAAGLIAYSRVRQGLHRPREVVAGALVGYGVAQLEQSLPRGILLAPFLNPDADGGGVEVIWHF